MPFKNLQCVPVADYKSLSPTPDIPGLCDIAQISPALPPPLCPALQVIADTFGALSLCMPLSINFSFSRLISPS